MLILILGLAIFFAIHMIQMLAPQWRLAKIDTMGEGRWKGIYTLVSLASLALIVWGFGQARMDNIQLFEPPIWASHAALLLMAIAFILMMAANLKPGRIKQAVKHPFLVAVKIWALAHLLANGDIASMVLFGSFLAYAVLNRISVKRRGQPDPVAQSNTSDIIAVVSGLAIWAIFVWVAHEYLFGVSPIA